MSHRALWAPCPAGKTLARMGGGTPRPGALARALLLCSFILSGAAIADEPADTVEKVVIQATKQATPPSEAVPGQGSPQSVVSSEVIQTVVSPVGDFGTIADLTPGYVSSAPNGPGFDAAKNMTLRGFADGQFNITMDGIPFADPDSFTHHSTSYFPASMLDHVVIDRSPGTAADLGYASFGGSINLYSEELPDAARERFFGSYGSFNTSLIGTTLSTARPQEPGQSGVLGTLEYAHSDGAMADSPGNKIDVLVKEESLLGPVRLTALYAYDSYHFYNPGSITTTELATYGPSYGYVSNLASPDDYHYSGTARSTDFGYVKLDAPDLGAWQLAQTLYTYSYRNTGVSLKGDQTSSPIGSGYLGISPTDIAGRLTDEAYRVVGDDLHASYTDSAGVLLLGAWAEHAWQNEWRDAEDLTTDELYDANKNAQSPVYFAFDAHLSTIQPYAQYTLKTWDPLQVQVGVRWRDVLRDFDAATVQSFLPGTDGTVTHRVTATLPSMDITYRLAEKTSIYLEAAQGSLVPSQSFLYTAHPAAGDQVNAEKALTTQLGIVRQTEAYALGLDVYNINFDNYVSTIVLDGDTLYVNSGSALYRGIEAEGHLDLGAGLALVANGSLSRATFEQSGITSAVQKAGDTLPFAPRYTGLVGLVLGRGRLGASLLTKFVGTEYQGPNGSADGATYRVGAYSYTNATLTYSFPHLLGTENVRLNFAIDNLLGSDAITDNAGPSAMGPDLVNVLPRRAFVGSFIADL